MEIVSSYKAQILSENSIFRDTIRIYRSALSFLIVGHFAQRQESEGTLQCG